MDDIPVIVADSIKQLRDKSISIHVRQNYYNRLVSLRDTLTKATSEYMLEFEGKSKKKKD